MQRNSGVKGRCMLDKYIKTKTFTYVYSSLLFVYALFFISFGWKEYDFYWARIEANDTMYLGIQGLVLIISVMLALSSRLSDAMLPAMVLAVLSTSCYNSADKFLSLNFLWVAPFAVTAFVFHFIKYRKPFKIGRSFWGLCAISVALIFGGIGTISASDYFSGTSLFYVLGLGIGMVLFYLLVKSQMGEEEKQSVARVMYLSGMLAACSVFLVWIQNWDVSIGAGKILHTQFCNNLSTFMMMSLPFVLFYPSRKKRFFDFLSFAFMYAALLCSSSRAGLILGTVEAFCLLFVYCFIYKKGRAAILPRILFVTVPLLACSLVWKFLPELLHMLRLTNATDASRVEILKNLFASFFDSGDSRIGLFRRMIRDVKSNPIFGAGLGNTGNTDLYNPVKGAMVWYHMWLPQIVGSLGLVGIAAYGYQLVARVRIYLKNPGFVNRTFFLSYLGLLLMSQVNPGEFCPVPYAMLAVTCFVLIESPEDDIPIGDLFKRKKITNDMQKSFDAQSKTAQ